MGTVTICGIPYKVILTDRHLGQIDYVKCEIRVNGELKGEALKETIRHEIVQSLRNAINQTFEIKEL